MDAKDILQKMELLLEVIGEVSWASETQLRSELRSISRESRGEYIAALNYIQEQVNLLSEQPEKEPNNGPQ